MHDSLAQFAQNGVVVVLPNFQGTRDVAVIQFAEPIENFRIRYEFCAIQRFVDEDAQRGSSENINPG